MRRWLLGLLGLIGLLVGGLVFYAQSHELPFLTSMRPLPSRVPPAFYSGGLEKGTGGQVVGSSQYGQAYTGQDLFAPSAAQSQTGGLYPLEAYPSPATCARCHVGIHNNWAKSGHAVSATNPWYGHVKELLEFEQGGQAARLCASCHAPVALMTGEVGLYNKESPSAIQGVSCIFCHSIEVVHGGNGGYVSNPGRIRMYQGGDYLSEKSLEAAAHAVMAAPAVHKSDMHPVWYAGVSGSQICQSCHQLELNGVKIQTTFEEWQNSDYYRQGVSCQDCHFTPGAGFTKDPGHKVEHYPQRPHIFKHYLGGGSTFNSPDPQTNIAVLKEAVGLEAKLEGYQLMVTVSNLKAGHSLPTGVGDLRQMWVEVTALDAKNQLVYKSGHLDKAGNLELNPKPMLFHQSFADESGTVLALHNVWRAKKVVEDTRIPAKGRSSQTFRLPNSSHSIKVHLLWRDAPAEFAVRVLNRGGNTLPITVLKSWEYIAN